MILPKLCEVFPEVQFIVTTHSPQILGEVKPESIWILEKNIEEHETQAFHPEQAYGLSSSEVLEFMMESSPRTQKVQKALDEISSLLEAEEFEKARSKIMVLSKLLNGKIPPLYELEAFLVSME
jgi:predicted ATP-binding protein involved in virulence